MTKPNLLFLFPFIALCIMVIYQSNQRTDLEIYTTEDVYYIDNLTVKSESGEVNFTFKTKEELKTFISDITAIDANTCQELVYKLEKTE